MKNFFFVEMREQNITVDRKPPVKESEGAQSLGAIFFAILSGILLILMAMDVPTIRRQLPFFRRNLRDARINFKEFFGYGKSEVTPVSMMYMPDGSSPDDGTSSRLSARKRSPTQTAATYSVLFFIVVVCVDI